MQLRKIRTFLGSYSKCLWHTNISIKFVFLCSEAFLFVVQDLPGALDDAAVTEALELHKIKNRQWAIFKASAIKGEGLFEGLDW